MSDPKPLVATIRGARENQEDRFLVLRADRKNSAHAHARGWLLAVMDGNGGAEAAQTAVELLPAAFTHAYKAHRENLTAALAEAVSILNDDPRIRYQIAAGCTASVVYVDEADATVHVAHLGDSPVIVFDAYGQILFRTEEHNVITNPREVENARELSVRRHGRDLVRVHERTTSSGSSRPWYIKDRRMEDDFQSLFDSIMDRIEKSHAAAGREYPRDRSFRDGQMLVKIMKGKGIQNTSQLGSLPFDDILCRKPDVAEIRLTPAQRPAYVLLATDGILDINPGVPLIEIEKEIAHLVAVNRLTPEQLVERAGGEKAKDNTTVVLHQIPAIAH